VRAAHLFVYPIKSCGGVEVDRLILDVGGVANDRVFVLVGEDGVHITQREAPQLAAIRTTLERQGLRVVTPGGREIILPYGGNNGRLTNVRVHRDGCHGLDQGDAAAEFFGDYLERPCRLLHVSEKHPRLRHPDGVSQPFAVGFSDGYPLLVISQASLDDLNTRLAEPVTMDRFRPNIVVEGSEAYAEDGWNRIILDGMVLEGAKRCVRCVITTTDQGGGHRHPEQEPLRTLARYRTDTTLGGAVFGRNYVHRTSGSLTRNARLHVA
jgi:MOSC domain-containing protein